MAKSPTRSRRSTPATSGGNGKAKAEPTPESTPEPRAARKGGKKAAIDRALKHARMLDAHARRMHRLVGNWNGEATKDQSTTNAELVANLAKASQLAKQILLDADMLKVTGFAPVAGSTGSIPLAAGERVVIKSKYWNPAVYGKANNFEVVLATNEVVRLKVSIDPRAPQVVVPRSYVEPVDEIEVDDIPIDDPDAASATAVDLDLEGDPDEAAPADDFEDDPRLPNAEEE